jgi:2-amino-4-hydroxy-6-hydroxymethyldihydropteridine diphosphokinase
VIAYLGLGSNVGDRLTLLGQVVRALQEAGARSPRATGPALRVLRSSSVYETVAIGAEGAEKPEQPPYLNAVLEIEVAIGPEELWWLTAGIEVALGRTSGPRFAPRTVDIDLLLFGDQTLARPELTIPHPRMFERGFVMMPLQELLPARWPVWVASGVERFAGPLL